ncbi:hypothetical protein PQY67_13120 [Pseudomonadales bacterium]|nr:hypothetical protein [Pseudomonadales bacterium]
MMPLFSHIKDYVIAVSFLFLACGTAGAEMIGGTNEITLPVEGQTGTSPREVALTIPNNIAAVSLNVTAVTPVSAGFITVYPCGTSRPLASNLNYTTGDVVANSVTAPVSENGKVCVYSSAQTHVVIDIAGWFVGSRGGFFALSPKRLVDTRLADSDGDNIADQYDLKPSDPSEAIDTDGDGIGNNSDLDDDNDGISDSNDGFPLISIGGLADADADGIPDSCGDDCLELGMTEDKVILAVQSDEDLAGVWFGSLTSNQGFFTPYEVLMVTTSDGEFAAVSPTNLAQVVGTATVVGDSLVANAIGIAPDGEVWLNGTEKIQINISGQLSEKSTISGLWNSTATAESGNLNLSYNSDLHNRGSSRSEFQGEWVTVETVTYSPSGIILYAGEIDARYQLTNGQFSGTDIYGCSYQGGDIAPIQAEFNTYRVSFTTSNCPINSANGVYSGLGVLIDTANGDGSINRDSALVTAINNGQYYVTDVLFINN